MANHARLRRNIQVSQQKNERTLKDIDFSSFPDFHFLTD